MKQVNRRDFFVPAGEVLWAQLLEHSPRFIQEGRVVNGRSPQFTKQQKEGLRFERRAIEYLSALTHARVTKDFELFPSRWISFSSKSTDKNIRFCQPDAFLLNERQRKIILFEIKLQHTQNAWRQVRLLYEPVLRYIYPGFSISAIELCKWLDPHSSFPEQYYYAEDIFQAVPDKFGIHLFKPGRAKRSFKNSNRRRV